MGMVSERIPDKLFFKEAEVVKLIKVSSRVLQLWASRIPDLSVQTDAQGGSLYKKEEVLLFQRVKAAIQGEGKSLEEALKSALSGDPLPPAEEPESEPERREEEREARAGSPSPAPVQRGGELIGEVREELEKLLTYLRK